MIRKQNQLQKIGNDILFTDFKISLSANLYYLFQFTNRVETNRYGSILALLSIGEGQVPVWIMRKLSADTISHKKIALCIEGSSTIPGSISCNIPFQQAFSNCSAPEKGCNFSCEPSFSLHCLLIMPGDVRSKISWCLSDAFIK